MGPSEPPKRKSRRDERRPHGVLVTYRGGPECWFEISYAGKTHRFPGWVQLCDAMATVLDIEV